MIQKVSTSTLWEQTHAALCAGSWSKARSLLDDLGRRADVVDLLLDLSQYERASGKTLPADYRPIIQDRLDLVNSKIETHRPTAVKPANVEIKEGSKWVANIAYGRKDAICFTVRGVTSHGIYITGSERTPGNLYSQAEFVKLFRPDPRLN